MNFLANGDYNFPFDFLTYFIKHFYMWSFQTGTPNPDGIIRLPGRIFNFIVFALGGNISVGYFYQIACLVIAFFAFYFFAREFVGIKDRLIRILGATFFAVNPIFLGNLSKVGLVLAVAMLPLCLVAIKQAFSEHRFSKLLLYIVWLNISLLHPYTFFVNLAISGVYLCYLAWNNRSVVRRHLPKFVGIGVLAVMLNAYLLLAIASMGTVSKDVISDNVTPIKADYTALVDVSNTRDVFTGLTLSKNIFLDFDFYNAWYQNIYYFGTFLLYIVLLVLYVKVEKRLSPKRKQLLITCFGGFLLFIALATVMLFNLDSIIKFLISMPGGWAFRSPLKWQLYIPLVLFTILVIILASVKDVRWRQTSIGLLMVSFVAMNGYQLFDVINKQLVPRQVTYFSELRKLDLKQKNLLFINSAECIKQVIPYNSAVVTELNQVFTSTEVQVKRAWADSIAGVNLANYDYVLTCRRNLSSMLKTDYSFAPSMSFVSGAMQLYVNNQPKSLAYATDTLYGLDDTHAVADKHAFVTHTLKRPFNFIDPDATKTIPSIPLEDVFAQVKPEDINGHTAKVTAESGGHEPRLLMDATRPLLFSKIQNGTVSLSPMAGNGRTQVKENSLDLPVNQSLVVAYQETGYDFKNLIENPSFEEGLWKDKPDDCFNFDSTANISIAKSTQATDGKMSMELGSVRHIACSGPDAVSVQPGEHYLLSFDYQSPDGAYAGYYIGFDDEADALGDRRLTESGNEWHSESKEIRIPAHAKKLRIKFYAYPDNAEQSKKVSRFDAISLIRIPPLMNRFYLSAKPTHELKVPASVHANRIDPTKWQIKISGASKPFYLITKETYHPKWQVQFAGGQGLDEKYHFAANNTMNGWYFDPAIVCKTASHCTRTSDGNYDIELTMQFIPQQWFYIGGGISILGALIAIGWYSHEARQTKKVRGRWR